MGRRVKLCVIGTGYVGLVTGTCFAATGQRVVCVDKDASKIERLQRYEIPIYEPGLEEMVKEQVDAGRLSFTTDLKEAVKDVDLAFIAVGTPPTHDGEADLSAVFAVAQDLAKHATHDLVIVNKSTVPVGTNAQVQKLVADAEHDIQASALFYRSSDEQLDQSAAYKLMTPIFGEGLVFDAPLALKDEQLKSLMPSLRIVRSRQASTYSSNHSLYFGSCDSI